MLARLLLGIMLALIRRLLESVGGCRKKIGVLGRKFLVKVPFSFDFFLHLMSFFLRKGSFVIKTKVTH